MPEGTLQKALKVVNKGKPLQRRLRRKVHILLRKRADDVITLQTIVRIDDQLKKLTNPEK